MTRVVRCVALAVVVAGPLAAQSVRLVYEPIDGTSFHRLFQVHTRLEVRAETLAVTETAEVGGLHQTALRGSHNEPILHLSYDSLRVLVRTAGGPWRQGVGVEDSAWVQAVVDDRLAVRQMQEGGTPASGPRLLALATGVGGYRLPGAPVRRGDRWRSSAVVPVGDTTGGAPRPVTLDVITTVDSVVVRARDTLAYLSLDGRVAGNRGADHAAYRGGLRGQLVWSSGWAAFVSGATRLRLRVGAGAAPAQVLMETTVRQQVRR